MAEPLPNASIDCGWGRLLFGQTFKVPAELAAAMRAEGHDRRDIAFYVRDPHVLLAAAPQELFLDPSHTYRLDLSTYRPSRRRPLGFTVRRMTSAEDAIEVNRIYAAQHMVAVPPDFFWHRRDNRAIIHLVAEDLRTGAIVGTVTGIDHARAFEDPNRGSSLWCLAVDPQSARPGIGETLVRHLVELFQTRGAQFTDLSVMHDNDVAIRLYEKLGFERLPFFTVKCKNPINERLFAGPDVESNLNPYARIIVDEARRRGIGVDVIDSEGGFFRLTYGGRSIACRESLSEFTTAVAMSICDDKAVTRRIVSAAGVRVPEQIDAAECEALPSFIEQHGLVVVKPARGEQGKGVAVGLDNIEAVERAVDAARAYCQHVLVEAFHDGLDLRLIVIDYRLVAAAIRKPASIVGDGTSNIRDLIERQSKRRSLATGGESRIPLDDETERCILAQEFTLDDVLERDSELQVRRTANLHTGGTIHDVTDRIHPVLVDAAIRAARAIHIPVVGIDFMVKSPMQPDYVFIEANERPGLANHEPQPTAERFVDLLFPLSLPAAARAAAAERHQKNNQAGVGASLPGSQ
ncbi:GNAT-family acetyltransferase TIGR03103 [Arboricoccus pini]|uniref:GNAT-family acetyltransferase TIGR03103 n=2 Tax=Arboricoccus pini TaxID=1963835 RepID=A0A212R7V0_9PROT|nr:GNAT-family acetyltransferase TIGR03103 [Arboricoccus pini]